MTRIISEKCPRGSRDGFRSLGGEGHIFVPRFYPTEGHSEIETPRAKFRWPNREPTLVFHPGASRFSKKQQTLQKKKNKKK